MLLNIIHPYLFKVMDGGLVIGPVPEFYERDAQLSDFVTSALDRGARVIHQDYHSPYPFQAAAHHAALSSDPLYAFLDDSRIHKCFTTPYGMPIPDRKPRRVTKEEWKVVREVFINHSGLGKLMGDDECALFVGGALEACLANATHYYRQKYRRNGEQVCYIDDFTVCVDAAQGEKARKKLAKLGIRPISAEQARRFLS